MVVSFLVNALSKKLRFLNTKDIIFVKTQLGAFQVIFWCTSKFIFGVLSYKSQTWKNREKTLWYIYKLDNWAIILDQFPVEPLVSVVVIGENK